MKLLYLNIFENGGGKERLDKIINFVNNERPDILSLSEVEKWNKDERTLLDFKLRTKFRYHFIKDHIIIFSNFQINDEEHIGKGIMKVKLTVNKKSISLIAAHLSPGFEDKRLVQIDKIIKKSNNEKTILIGDLNSLSPLDKYNEESLIETFRKINLKKFGDKKLRFDVQKKILNFGLIDTVKKFSNSFEYSVPTEFNKDPHHAAKLRLDYLYITPNLLPNLKSSRIIRNEETNQLSDHFPIIAEFDL